MVILLLNGKRGCINKIRISVPLLKISIYSGCIFITGQFDDDDNTIADDAINLTPPPWHSKKNRI